jgi:hypothetical protein
MSSFSLGIVLLFVAASIATGQDNASPQTPRVTLILPSGVASENVQINYFMVGAFGGYGNFVRAEKGKPAYDFVAAVDGKPAISIKMIAYVPGCEIMTLEIAVEGTALSRNLICKPLERVHLRGQISPASILQDQPAEVEVTYQAVWGNEFFGIADGMVPSIHIATVVPDRTGQFELDVPDLHAQNLGNGEFLLILRAAKSRNIIAFLESPDDGHGLAVLSSYPPLVRFVTNRQ